MFSAQDHYINFLLKLQEQFLAGTQEKDDVQFALKILNSTRERRLRDESLFGSFVDAATVGDFDSVAQLLKGHRESPDFILLLWIAYWNDRI